MLYLIWIYCCYTENKEKQKYSEFVVGDLHELVSTVLLTMLFSINIIIQ